jgi:23S rRNA pseudouridine1911/1915/1917 synthase
MPPNQSVDGEVHEALVGADETGMRLDRFLAQSLRDISRSRLQALIAQGAVTIDGETIGDADQPVKQGQVCVVCVPPPAPATPEAQNIPLKIIYEDSDVIVIDKPAGLVVHPAAGNRDGTLVNALLAHCKDLSGVGGVARPGIVHRLDKDTSGALVAAKNEAAMLGLSKQFAAHTVERAYFAVVWGTPRISVGKVEGNLGRNPFDRKKIGVLRSGGKKAITHYRVVERFGAPDRPYAALIRCRLETGRTHQIRVHLTHLGHPLIGDTTYGRSRTPPRPRNEAEKIAYETAQNFPRQALHAGLLGFHHPKTGAQMRFESPWPDDFLNLVNTLRGMGGAGGDPAV